MRCGKASPTLFVILNLGGRFSRRVLRPLNRCNYPFIGMNIIDQHGSSSITKVYALPRRDGMMAHDKTARSHASSMHLILRTK